MKNTKGVNVIEQKNGTCSHDNSTCDCTHSCYYTENFVCCCISLVKSCIFWCTNNFVLNNSIYILFLILDLQF